MRVARNADGQERTVLDWADVEGLVRALSKKIGASHFDPSVVVGILRGGVIPAVMLSHNLGIQKVAAVHCSRRGDGYTRGRATEFLSELVRGERVLLVDDVSHTGATLSRAKEIVMGSGSKECRSAIVGHDSLGGIACPADYVGIEIPAWIELPWEGR